MSVYILPWVSHPGYSQFVLMTQYSSFVAILIDELLIALLTALIMHFSSPWMFRFCSELLDRRGSKMNPGSWKWFKNRIPHPDTQLTLRDAFHSLLPVQFPVPVRMFSPSHCLCLGGGKAQELLLLLRQHGREEFYLKIPSVRKAVKSNDICLKILSFPLIHSVLSPWLLRPKERHLLIIQGKKRNKRQLPRGSLFWQVLFSLIWWLQMCFGRFQIQF